MLDELGVRVSERTLRLFVCACCRRHWSRLDDLHREAVELAERYADGEAARSELLALDYAIVSHLPKARKKRHPLLDAAHDAVATGATRAEDAKDYPLVALSASHSLRQYAPEMDQTSIIRCLCGNPYSPPPFDPDWLAWNDETVPKLAQAIYDDRRLPAGNLECQQLGILADALEDASCDDAEILTHLRTGGEHVRGCWVVDLLLGKS
jgi:hypothetical protein